MRTPDRQPNPLHRPLDHALARPAAIRVLRALVMRGRPVAPAELVRDLELSPPAVRAALTELARVGVAQVTSSGRLRSYVIAGDHPFRAPLAALFEAETARARRLEQALAMTARGALEHLGVSPREDLVAAWARGIAAEDVEWDGPPEVRLAAPARLLDALEREFRALIEQIATREHLDIAFHPVRNGQVRIDSGGATWWSELGRRGVTLVGDGPSLFAHQLRTRDVTTSHALLG